MKGLPLCLQETTSGFAERSPGGDERVTSYQAYAIVLPIISEKRVMSQFEIWDSQTQWVAGQTETLPPVLLGTLRVRGSSPLRWLLVGLQHGVLLTQAGGRPPMLLLSPRRCGVSAYRSGDVPGWCRSFSNCRPFGTPFSSKCTQHQQVTNGPILAVAPPVSKRPHHKRRGGV